MGCDRHPIADNAVTRGGGRVCCVSRCGRQATTFLAFGPPQKHHGGVRNFYYAKTGKPVTERDVARTSARRS